MLRSLKAISPAGISSLTNSSSVLLRSSLLPSQTATHFLPLILHEHRFVPNTTCICIGLIPDSVVQLYLLLPVTTGCKRSSIPTPLDSLHIHRMSSILLLGNALVNSGSMRLSLLVAASVARSDALVVTISIYFSERK